MGRCLAMIGMLSTLGCATGLPTQATRVVQPDASRTIELVVGEQARIDPPTAGLHWSLTGGDNILTITPAPGDPPQYWILIARRVGEADIVFEGAPPSVSSDAPGGASPPAPPTIQYVVRVIAPRQ